jgi:hypothetical protein
LMVRIHHGPPYFYKEFKALHLCSAFFWSEFFVFHIPVTDLLQIRAKSVTKNYFFLRLKGTDLTC